MSERIKNDDVREAFESMKEQAVAANVKGAENWTLYFGQTSRGYQCWIANRQGHRVKGTRNLGSTKREAEQSMLSMSDAFALAGATIKALTSV